MLFICLSGISGSGKSTFIKNFISTHPDKSIEVVSTDAIRKELLGDESDQSNGDLIFKTAYSRLTKYLTDVNTDIVFFDATNLSRKARKKVLEVVTAANPYASYFCYFFKSDVDRALYQNEQRDRKVPKEVIMRQRMNFSSPTYDEGWTFIYQLN